MVAILPLLAAQTKLKKVDLDLDSLDTVKAVFTSLPKSVQYLKLSCYYLKDVETLLVLLLNCTVQSVKLNNSFVHEKFKELLYKYLEDNQQSEGNRTRSFYGWNFRVSANNKILNM